MSSRAGPCWGVRGVEGLVCGAECGLVEGRGILLCNARHDEVACLRLQDSSPLHSSTGCGMGGVGTGRRVSWGARSE